MNRPVVYTSGAFDLFHRGHLRMLSNASALGETLIVGVSTDDLIESYKSRSAVVPFEERIEIVRAIRHVDIAIPQHTQDKYEIWRRVAFDVWVVGDDWFGDAKYERYREQLEAVGVDCVFLPYTAGVSSTHRREIVGSEFQLHSRKQLDATGPELSRTDVENGNETKRPRGSESPAVELPGWTPS
jgi:glycerol-3-phosphate cytidylyltransferase